ncbi:MAG: phosphoribosylformylglycinamidine synthase subunit PurS [Gemmatimonadetes bacterium]|nr:phosphoribosylformylglycinamidine synthase subunit PurS [Gemmatimonadota bacterium]
MTRPRRLPAPCCNQPPEEGTLKRYHLEVRVKPRPGLLDPQGRAIQHALDSLGFAGTEDIRVGKVIDLALMAGSPDAAVELGREMCRKLLANPVTEDFQVTLMNGARPVEGAE